MQPFARMQADLTTVLPRHGEASTELLIRKVNELRANRHYHHPEKMQEITVHDAMMTLTFARQAGNVRSRASGKTLLWTLVGDNLYQ